MRAIGISGLLGASLCALGMSMPASAIEQGDWMVRARILAVSPNDDSGLVSTGTTGPIAGSGVKVDTGYTLDLDFSYMFTDNIGAELLLDLTSGHDVIWISATCSPTTSVRNCCSTSLRATM
jgi:outer membrane protein